MKKQKLYLLTQAFPIKQRESSFISPEFPFLKENFDVTIVPLEECSHTAFSRLKAFIKSLCSPLLYKQVFQGKKQGKSAFKVFQFSLFMLWRANTYADYLEKNIFSSDSAVVYGYWYNEIILSALLLKNNHPNYKYITRCHGYDVYDFRVPGSFHPYKSFMDSRLDKVVFACNHAKNYYLHRYNIQDSEKYIVSYLGVPQKNIDKAVFNQQNNDKKALVIVSCSSVIELKRVHLIADALRLIDDINIEWHHFGSGNMMDNLKEHAEFLLKKDNISYTLHGFVENDKYIKLLGEMNADLFITLSSTEGGVPVSISEAASFGIPVIATAVGGIVEIVSDDNGILLCENACAEDAANAVRSFYSLSFEEKRQKKLASLKKWEQNFNSRKNSENLINILKQL